MKILFMGTPDFAAESLNAMIRAKLDVAAVISQPDKPKGRGHKLMPTDVKVAAQAAGIEVYQPESLKNEAILPLLREINPELIVVAAYGKILPEYIINYPKYGCINVHASLLPKYRGAAPIQWSVINGDLYTGVTIMQMDKGLDTGDMISTVTTEIGEYETAGELFDRLAVMGGELLVKTIADIENGKISPTPQNHDEHTYAPMLNKELGKIDWNKSTREISKLICGMNPWPLAYTLYKGEVLKIVDATMANDYPKNGKCGEILALEKGRGLMVSTGDGTICIKTAQFPESRKMSVEDYARGHEVEKGVILGE
ncbi:MAG: methionyl-tRNA formyltransferase [Clostridia bacterium]|nr:methionyl-tRNA formyltransferase [Clostridia bacterium]